MSFDRSGNPIDASIALFGNNANDAPGYAIDYTDPNSPQYQEAVEWLSRNPGDWSRVNAALAAILMAEHNLTIEVLLEAALAGEEVEDEKPGCQ